MSFPAYPNYQDSGDPILGPLPSHWSVSKIKWYTDVFSGYDATAGTGDIPVYGANGVLGRAERPTFYADRVLIGRVGSSGTVNLATGQFCVSDNALVVEIRRALDCRFVYYWALSQDFSPDITTTSQPLLTGASVKNYRIGFPEHQEQRQIADFLDHETARIDALIEEQQRLIDLVEEKRHSYVYFAITKGLEYQTTLEDCGVEWLGRVPAHWDVLPARYVFTLQRGVDLSSSEMEEGPHPVVGSNGQFAQHTEFVTRGPGVTVGRSGSVGEVHYIEDDFWPHNTALYVKDLKGNSPKYIYYLLKALNPEHLAAGTAVGTLDRKQIHRMYVALPPREEAKRIADKIDQELDSLDALAREARELIELLRERRRALISAVVTGKIDVRNWSSGSGRNIAAEPAAAEGATPYG